MLARDSSVLECLNAGGCFPLYEHRVKLRCLSSCHIRELAGSVGGLTIIAALLASVYMYMYFLLAFLESVRFLCFAIGRRLVFEAMEVRPLFDLPRQHSASPGLRNPEDLSKDISKRVLR